MKFLLLNLVFLSMASYAVEFEVIGDFRTDDDFKNWNVETSLSSSKAALTQLDKKALFFSRFKGQKSELVKSGDWDFSQFTNFMADVSSDGQPYTVSLTDEQGELEDYRCLAEFQTDASAVISTVNIPVSSFECEKDGAVLDLESIKKVGIASKNDSNFAIVMFC